MLGTGVSLATAAAGLERPRDEPDHDGADLVSRLASGLAHELANSLTTVHGYAHLVDRSVLSAADRSALDQITANSEKMLSTVDAFRALVRPLPIAPTTFAPVDAVQAAIILARQEADLPDAVVHVTPAPSGTVHGTACSSRRRSPPWSATPSRRRRWSRRRRRSRCRCRSVRGAGRRDRRHRSRARRPRGRPCPCVPALPHRQARARRAGPRPRRTGAARASGCLHRARASAHRRARRHDRPAAARLNLRRDAGTAPAFAAEGAPSAPSCTRQAARGADRVRYSAPSRLRDAARRGRRPFLLRTRVRDQNDSGVHRTDSGARHARGRA